MCSNAVLWYLMIKGRLKLGNWVLKDNLVCHTLSPAKKFWIKKHRKTVDWAKLFDQKSSIFNTIFAQTGAYKLKRANLTRPFIEGATQKGQSKGHCMCIKQKQNISLQSYLRNPMTVKSSSQIVICMPKAFPVETKFPVIPVF